MPAATLPFASIPFLPGAGDAIYLLVWFDLEVHIKQRVDHALQVLHQVIKALQT